MSMLAYTRQVLIEAITIGAVFAMVGSIASRLTMRFGRNPQFDIWNIEWNDYNQLELLWFSTAAALHLIFEFTGLNAWYGKNGAAVVFA